MLNKATLIGNLGADPDVRYLPSGGAVTTISIATTRRWKDKQTGERRDATEWHRVVFFNRIAEVAGEYLKKGSQIYVEGRIQTNKWTDKEGIDRYSTEIIANEMTMLGSRTGGTAPLGQEQQTTQNSYQAPAAQTPAAMPQNTAPVSAPPIAPVAPVITQAPATTTPPYEDFDDEIPF